MLVEIVLLLWECFIHDRQVIFALFVMCAIGVVALGYVTEGYAVKFFVVLFLFLFLFRKSVLKRRRS